MGDLTDEDQNCRLFARDLNAVCVNVDYRLAPEHKFPTGVNDAYDAVKWCAKNASPTSDVLPADPGVGFIVGGASEGGNFAAVMCQIARDEGLEPPLTGQYLCVPALLSGWKCPTKWGKDFQSRFVNVNDPVLKVDLAAKLDPARDRGLNELGADPGDPRYSPLLHENLAGVPPAFFQLAGLDPRSFSSLVWIRCVMRG